MKPRYSRLSLALALCIGVVAAWRFGPDIMLQQIVSDDPADRIQGWAWLLSGDRLMGSLDAINSILESASDEVLLDASAQLRSVNRWNWDAQPAALLLREAKLRGSGDATEKLLAASLMATCPLDLPEQQVVPVLWTILNGTDGSVRDRATEVAFGWIGPHRFHSVRALPLLEQEDSRRIVRLAVYWAHGRHVREPLPSAWAQLDAHAAMTYLNRSVIDDEGMVYASALLAEHSLPQAQAVELAKKWIVHLDNDRKRAGALLAALLGEHAELVHQALDVATDAHVRTTLRQALYALGRPVAGEDEREFMHRTMHMGDGRINPDALLCLLVAGDNDALRLLAETPQSPTGESLRARTLLIERFVPYWNIHQAVEQSEVDPLQAYYEAIAAVWMLTHRWMDFDHATRTWSERPLSQ